MLLLAVIYQYRPKTLSPLLFMMRDNHALYLPKKIIVKPKGLLEHKITFRFVDLDLIYCIICLSYRVVATVCFCFADALC